MATPIATGALKPKTAVLLAAVSQPRRCLPVDRGLQDHLRRDHPRGCDHRGRGGSVPLSLIFAGLIGAITWNMLTWLLGLPSSSSHALFGGLIGATLVGSRHRRHRLRQWCSPRSCSPAADRSGHGRPDRLRRDEDRLLDHPSLRTESPTVATAIPVGADLHLLAGRAGSRHQRRPEDDGCDHPRDDHDRLAVRRSPRARAVGHHRVCVHDRARHLPGRLAHHPHPRQGPDRRQARTGLRSSESSTAATILASSALGFALSTTQVASGSVIGSGLGSPRVHGCAGGPPAASASAGC